MFSQIYNFLKNKGYDVYSIGQHEGKCNNPYIVIQEKGIGQITGTRLSKSTIDLLVYYPKGQYSKFPVWINDLKLAMREFNKAKRVHDAMSTIIDDDKQAYHTSLTYEKIRTKEGA